MYSLPFSSPIIFFKLVISALSVICLIDASRTFSNLPRRGKTPYLSLPMTDKPDITVFPILSDDKIEDALNDLAWNLKGIGDHIASARYKRDLLRKIGKLTIGEAKKCQKF